MDIPKKYKMELLGMITAIGCKYEEDVQHWIPVKWREPTEEESAYYTYMADCPMPEDGQDILVTDGRYVWKDECFYDDGFNLDSLEDWRNITAWMPLPKPFQHFQHVENTLDALGKGESE